MRSYDIRSGHIATRCHAHVDGHSGRSLRNPAFGPIELLHSSIPYQPGHCGQWFCGRSGRSHRPRASASLTKDNGLLVTVSPRLPDATRRTASVSFAYSSGNPKSVQNRMCSLRSSTPKTTDSMPRIHSPFLHSRLLHDGGEASLWKRILSQASHRSSGGTAAFLGPRDRNYGLLGRRQIDLTQTEGID